MKAAAIAVAILAAAVGLFLRNAGPDPNAVPTSDEVAERTMSPFCEGLTLTECPHSKSAALRDVIAGMIAEGSTNREIDAWMSSNYGIVSQGRPGSGPAWLVPPLLALAGLLTVFAVISKRSPRPAAAEGGDLNSEEEDLFAADFRGFFRGSE